MRLQGGLDTRHLLQMLGEALIKEQEAWKPVHYRLATCSTVRSPIKYYSKASLIRTLIFQDTRLFEINFVYNGFR